MLYVVVNHNDTFSRDETHICFVFLRHKCITTIIFGVYFHLLPYFSHMINEGSNETVQKCTLVHIVAYRP